MNLKLKGRALDLCLLLPLLAFAEQQMSAATFQGQEQATAKGPDTSLPRVSLVYDHPEVAPNHFEIEVDSAGNASYTSRSESKPDSLDATSLSSGDFARTFKLSATTRDRIFQLAKAARYFD